MSRIPRLIVNGLLLFFGLGALAKTPLHNLQVTLRGTKYEINDVTTVGELKEKIKEVSGNSKEHHVLFGGKRLSPSTDLSEAGVEDGAQLNMVPVLSTKAKNSKDKSATSPPVSDSIETTTTSESTTETTDAMMEYLKKSGVDTDKLDELFKGMGGGSGDGKMPDMNESLEQMTQFMSSPLFQKYMNDPDMLEQARQMILNNPMLKSMMVGMPGMAELLDDPVAWREAMQAAAELYKHLDSDQLKAMMNGMGGMGGPPGGGGGGLFDGTMDNSAASAALDELDED
ncbi:hypothetical protein ACA910_015040 [Epithemia clementina (nom. ined.)]